MKTFFCLSEIKQRMSDLSYLGPKIYCSPIQIDSKDLFFGDHGANQQFEELMGLKFSPPHE